jgi:iron-sulfur cluster assembly accessory protein
MAFMSKRIDRKLVVPPTIYLTERAYQQLKLIIENDFTLAGKYFRVGISGKGCDGFTYSVMFTDLLTDDFLINIANQSDEIQIVLDPFAAFYLGKATIDFIQDFEQEAEGFVVTNHQQKNFQGKFFNKNNAPLPPLEDEGSVC